MNKTITYMIFTLLIVFNSMDTSAQLICELPTMYEQAFDNLADQESNNISQTASRISNSIDNVTEAINDETYAILESMNKYSAQKAAYDDAMNQMTVIRNIQAANVDSQSNVRAPDYGNKACAKATNAKNWTKTRAASKGLAKNTSDNYMELMNKNEDSIKAASRTMDHHILWFSDIDPSKPNNPFLNADTNAGSIFGHSTFRNLESTDIIPVLDPFQTPNTLTAAKAFSINAIGNKGIPKVSLQAMNSSSNGKLAKARQLRTASRKNLAMIPFADMIGRRTTVKDSGTGKWLRSYYSKLGGLTGYSNKVAGTIADDISEYEYQDHMYSKLYTNPDWIVSLEAPGKQLQLEELEIVNKNMALEWDTFLTLEKLATIDGVNLATLLDKKEK